MIAPESGASRRSTLIDHLRSFNRKTPQDAKGSSSEVLVDGTVSPGGGLVVAGAGPETAVQVADEAVGEGA